MCVHNQPNKDYETQYLYIVTGRYYYYTGINLYIEISKGECGKKCSKDYNSCNPYYTFLPHSRKGIKETLKYDSCMNIQIVSVPINFYTCGIDSSIIL